MFTLGVREWEFSSVQFSSRAANKPQPTVPRTCRLVESLPWTLRRPAADLFPVGL